MKTLLLFTFILSVSAEIVVGQSLKSSTDSLSAHVYYLASGALEGRDTGSKGQKLAANYISQSFKNYNLKPMFDTNFFHPFTLQALHQNQSKVSCQGSLIHWWNYLYASGYNHNDTVITKLVFCGYGSKAEVETLNIDRKALAFISDDPNQAYATIKTLNQQFKTTKFFVIFPKKNNDLKEVWIKQYNQTEYKVLASSLNQSSATFLPDWANPSDSLAIYYCFPNVLSNFFLMKDKDLVRVAKNNLKSSVNLLSGVLQPTITCRSNFADTMVTLETENVAGFIKGIDTTKTLIISAHYDHVGIENGKINYGADDNASGTAVLLETARILSTNANNGKIPDINISFVAFSGEELGLLGSEALVMDPKFNLNSVVGNINLDMVGRWDERHENNRDFVYLLTCGKNHHKRYQLSKKIDHPNYFKISNNPGLHERLIFKYGSDHYSFLKRDIPVVVFFTGLHDDYHTPKDTPDKINYKNMGNIANILPEYTYLLSGYLAK